GVTATVIGLMTTGIVAVYAFVSAGLSWDNTIKLWNVKTGNLLQTLASSVNSVAYSPDGCHCLSDFVYRSNRSFI
ncbi:MAG: hypothetical protein ACKO2Z_31010, partial [Sphaerospermopsis kisseleviana]